VNAHGAGARGGRRRRFGSRDHAPDPAIGAGNFSKSKAKRIFYTKAQADERYVNADEVGAGPVAYAHVSANGSLDTGASRNMTSTSKGATGYCCVDVAVPFANVQVTADGGSQRDASATRDDPFTSCPATADLTVQTYSGINGGAADSNFWILFH
jgi:hypothetical protein